MTMRWVTVSSLILLTGCAANTPVCSLLESRNEWLRIDSPPDFVSTSTLEEMFPRGTSSTPEDLVWYSDSAGRFAACLPGNRYGCGDSVSYFKGNEMEDISEIVLCGESGDS